MTIGLEVLVTLYDRLRRQLLLDWTTATGERPFASQRQTLVPEPEVAFRRSGRLPFNA